MANKNLFAASRFNTPATDTTNDAGGVAYKMSDEHALLQYASYGTFANSFYASAETQLDKVLKLANAVSPACLAKVTVYSRNRAYMKDVPAFLTAVLYLRDPSLWEKVFPRVIRNAKMLRNYAQIARSGKAGKVINLSNARHKKVIQKWFDAADSAVIFKGSVGNDPSLVNVLRMAHVKPNNKEKESLLKYLFNNEFGWTHTQEDRVGKSLGSSVEDLPDLVKRYENFKADKNSHNVPEVDFQQLTALGLDTKQWTSVFQGAGWHFTRMNLNTATRHKVLDDPAMVRMIANRLRDEEAIRQANVFPYQLFTAFLATRNNVPHEISEALQDAAEISLSNVPEMGNVVVAVDVSGSMGHAVTGSRGTATSVVRNVDLAALIASAILRKNKTARILPFANAVKKIDLNCRDSIMTNAKSLSDLLGGGTNCAAPIKQLNDNKEKADAIVLVSDNESWIDHRYGYSNGTAVMSEWLRFKKHNPDAKLICIDLSPNATTQVKERADILQIAGMNDFVFSLMADFIKGGNSANYWTKELEKIEV